MKIVKLEAQNVKRLKAVEIRPDGNTVVIGGRNGQGKSSVLDCIAYALGGKDVVCQQPVRSGESKAKVVCQLDDMIVTRTFTDSGGGTLTVTNADGTAKYASPQKMLDALVGRLTFDPLEFLRMKPVDQQATLKDLMPGLDFSELDADRQNWFDQRTQINREIKALEGQLAGMPKQEAPEQEVSVVELADKLEKIRNQNQLRHEAQREAEAIRGEISAADQSIKKAKEEIAKWQKYIEDHEAGKEKLKHNLARFVESANAIPVADPEPIRQQIANAQEINRKVHQNKARFNVAARLEAAKAESEKHSREIESIDAAKAKALAAAKFPIEGLSISDSGVTFGGVPFEQCSSAEQLRVSVAMGLAMNPKLKVLLIRDGSLLDDDSLAMISDMAKQADAQIWLEVVSSDGEGCSVVIEDGQIAGAAEKNQEAEKCLQS